MEIKKEKKEKKRERKAIRPIIWSNYFKKYNLYNRISSLYMENFHSISLCILHLLPFYIYIYIYKKVHMASDKSKGYLVVKWGWKRLWLLGFKASPWRTESKSPQNSQFIVDIL